MSIEKLSARLIALSILLFLPTASPQIPPRGASAEHNFYEIQRRYNERFAAKAKERKQPPREGEPDDEEARFRRFEVFWGPRVDAKGGFTTYYESLNAYEKLNALSFELACDTCRGACNKTFWTQLGPQSLPTQNMGAILSLWVNPNDPNEILAGTYNSGLYRTNNHGANWERITTLGCKGECSEFPQGGVTSIAVNPQNKDIIYITLGINRGLSEAYSLGVYKTTNGGITWCPTDLKFEPSEGVATSKVVIDPNYPNTLYAFGGRKVYRTTDGGATWKSPVLYTSPSDREIQDIAVSRNPGSAGLYFSEGPQRCFSTTPCSGGSGWYCPIADGKIWYDPYLTGTFTDITAQALGFTPSQNAEVTMERALFSVTPNGVSILALSDQQSCPYTQNGNRIIARDSNNGPPTQASSWVQHVNPLWAAQSHSSGYASAFAVSPLNDNLVLIGSDHGYASLPHLFISDTGGGQPTTPLNKFCPHADLRALAFAGKVGLDEIWIVGNDGGVAEARVNPTNPNLPCTNLNGFGLTATDFFGISNSEVDPSKVYGGAQDNGVIYTAPGVWEWNGLGDGYDVAADVTDPKRAYIATNYSVYNGVIYGGFYYTTDGGNNWSIPAFVPNDPRLPNMPLVIDRSNALYMARRNVWRIHSPATAMTQLSNWSDGVLRALHVPALNPSTIIAAKDGVTLAPPGTVGKIFRTDAADYNVTAPVPWADITYDLPVTWQLVTGITSDEKGENVWVSMGNFGPHVLVLRKGSKKWEDYSQGLPNLPANVIRYWEGSGDDGLFVGTDVGVYYRNRNMAEWRRISCELPNVLVSDLEINNRSQKLRAATRGMGVWETSLAAIKNQGCAGGSYLAASYTAGSGATNKDLQNNAVVTDAVNGSPVTLTPRSVCCVEPCAAVPNYSWKVYRLGVYTAVTQLVASGQNSPVAFTPDFLGPHPPATRGNYKVEVTGVCADKACPALTVSFNR